MSSFRITELMDLLATTVQIYAHVVQLSETFELYNQNKKWRLDSWLAPSKNYERTSTMRFVKAKEKDSHNKYRGKSYNEVFKKNW